MGPANKIGPGGIARAVRMAGACSDPAFAIIGPAFRQASSNEPKVSNDERVPMNHLGRLPRDAG
jgi:hypothetical protein